MTCYLVRHGKDNDTVRGGWSNSNLSPEGTLQVKHLSEHIVQHKNELKIEGLFSSDLPRAVQTAMPISKMLNLEIQLLPDFRETNNGLLAGMPNDIANEKYPNLYWGTLEWSEPYPQGESPCMFYTRIKTAWEQFSNLVSSRNQNVILVTHSGVINVIYSLVNGTAFSNKTKAERVPYAALIPIKNIGGSWKI